MKGMVNNVNRRFVRRPLALFSMGFALAAIIFSYLSQHFLPVLGITVVVGMISVALRRTYKIGRAHV